MFIRCRKVKNGSTRVQIVETYRVGNKIIQKVLRHAGTAKNDRELEELKRVAEYLKETIEAELNPKLFTKEHFPEKVAKSRLAQVETELPMLVNLHNLREEARIITGFHEIYGRLFDAVGYGTVLKSSKVSNRIFKDIVLARLAQPVSKRASCEMLESNFGISYNLEQIYRMLDAIKSEKKNAKNEVVLIDKIPDIQNITFQYSKRLLSGKVSLFFYDCTTLYFESFTEDELRRFGYSKDHKFNQGQVLLALTVTEEGLPVGYEVFAGNMYEGDTFSLAINKLKEKYSFAVLSQYHGLWQVEESFRIEKHDLRMRPVFHWSPDRIKAHLAICFVAFSLIRFLQHHIKKETNELFSARRISMELSSVQESILYDVRDKNNRYVIPSKSSDNVLLIYKTMKINRNPVPYKLKE